MNCTNIILHGCIAFDAFECQYVREKLADPWEDFSWKTRIKFVSCSRGGNCNEANDIILNPKLANSRVHIIRNFGLHYNEQVF